MIVDRAGGYMLMDRELWVKLLQENMKEKGLRFSKAEVPEQRIAIGLKRTCISGLSAPRKRKARMKES
jgi:hypothetical protein